MPTLAHVRPAAATQPEPQWPALTDVLDRPGRAQNRAIMAWHGRHGLVALDQAIERDPHYPLINCNERARSFAPARSAPAGAA